MKDNYTNYDVINFAEDPSFIRWVRHPDADNEKFWRQWAADHPHKSEVIAEAKQLVLAVKIEEEEPSDRQVQDLWQKIEAQIEAKPQKQAVVRRLPLVRWISYAAVLAALSLGIWLWYTPETTVIAKAAIHLEQTLPDNSTVELNAVSSVSFNERSWSKERVVEMKGEAFFDVEKGAPFRVVTPLGSVEVLGTSFNVYARGSDFVVDCFTGRVKVTAPSGSVQILEAGQGTQLTQEGRLTTPEGIKTETKATWRVGKFSFDGPLSHAFEELERQFGVQIKASETILKKEGALFFDNSNLEEALRNITYSWNLKYEIEGEVVEIRE